MRKVIRSYVAPAAVLCALLFTPGHAERPHIIVLEGDVWPPYVMDTAEGRNGFLVDIGIAALKFEGYSARFINAPWTRALADVRTGHADGVAGIYYTDAENGKLILPEQEIGISINKFYVAIDSKWNYRELASIKEIKLGTIDSYDYGELNSYITTERKNKSGKVEAVYGDHALEKNLRKLLLGRVDVIIDDQLVVPYVAAKMGIQNKIREAGTVKPPNRVGIAFSPANPHADEYAKALSRGLEKMRKSGELKKMLESYSVNDWR